MIIVFFLVFCFASSEAFAVSGVYPDEPKFGIQSVSFTVSGATISSYSDPQYGFVRRRYEGTLGTGTLRVQGTVTATDDMRSALIKVYVGLGAGGGVYSNEYRVEFGRSGQENFDVSVPIPAELPEHILYHGAAFEIFVHTLKSE